MPSNLHKSQVWIVEEVAARLGLDWHGTIMNLKQSQTNTDAERLDGTFGENLWICPSALKK